MHVYFCCVYFSVSVLSQEIGWEEHLRNNVFCVGWDVKPELSQSIHKCMIMRMSAKGCGTDLIPLKLPQFISVLADCARFY